MTLATRCKSCGTTFKVVQDQLRVSDGWVRCGRCDAVFDALDALIDLEAESASPESHGHDRSSPPEAPAPQRNREPIDIQGLLERHDNGALAEPADFASPEDDFDDTPAQAESPSQLASDPAVDDASLDTPEKHKPVDPPATLSTLAAAAAARLAAQAPGETPPQKPGFLREADRAARASSPAMRAAWIGSSLILLLMLMLQVVYHQRDSIAARSSVASSLLRGACARWNCKIEPPRRIQELAIESSALSKISGQPESVKLTLTLRNRSLVDLAIPAVELSLTDYQGKLIARRALSPRDFQIDPPAIAGGTELPLQLVMSTSERRVAGYTVELFYP